MLLLVQQKTAAPLPGHSVGDACAALAGVEAATTASIGAATTTASNTPARTGSSYYCSAAARTATVADPSQQFSNICETM